MRSPAPRTPSLLSLPSLSASSSFSSASDGDPVASPFPSPRLLHLQAARRNLRDSPYPSPLPSPTAGVPASAAAGAGPRAQFALDLGFMKGAGRKAMPSPGGGGGSPGRRLLGEAFTGDGFPWKGGGAGEGHKSPGSPTILEHVASTTAHAPTPAPTRTAHTWSHHEHFGSPSSPPTHPHSHSHSHRPPTPNPSLNRHQQIKLARQTISVQTTVAPPPPSWGYFDLDPELTALSSRESNRESSLSASGMVNGGRCGGRSRAPRGLKPLTTIQKGEGGAGVCPLRSILGAPTPPLR